MFEEDSDTLFDVFESEVPISEFTNGEVSSDIDHTAEQKHKNNKQAQQNADNNSRDQSHKRSLRDTDAATAQSDTDHVNGYREDDTNNHAAKKFKLTEEAPQPIVADEFEQESTREVVNIPGLQASSADDSQAGIILSHQVCYWSQDNVLYLTHLQYSTAYTRFAIKSHCHPTILTYPFPSTFLPRILLVHTHLP